MSKVTWLDKLQEQGTATSLFSIVISRTELFDSQDRH
jgi:hypothetical protein